MRYFRIYQEEEKRCTTVSVLYVAETKALAADARFRFRIYAKSRFFLDAAHYKDLKQKNRANRTRFSLEH